MNCKEFIDKLEYLLQDIEDVERDEAIQYYKDYFDEAGPENIQQVIEELGSPERVAAIIKAGLDNKFDQDIEYSEKGMNNDNYKEAKEVIEAEIVDHNNRKKRNFRGNPERNRILIVLVIIGAIFFVLPIGGGLFGVAMGVFATLFVLGVAILFGGVACLIGAIACFVKGILLLSLTPGLGLIILSTGFGLIALSVGFFSLSRGIIKVIPIIFNGAISLIREVISKVGELL